ncbi:restriction endonuclease subunit S [Paraliobacillus sp. JSM ZJ581]|uniref:restriction endonuclease subunit S n=1 Tax=Paraliobacillus sp. JSM ZJ581 TaxID=3342118 RepID=UPI0035A8A525
MTIIYDWEQRKLSEMTVYKNGKGHEDRQSTSGNYELINLNSISIDGGLKHSGKFIDDAADTLLKDDLVMILSDVGHGDLLGRVALIPENNRFVLNQRVALLRPNETANAQFLFSYINAHQYYFKSQGAGMSQLNISKGSVENFKSFVPNLEEQRKTGEFFKDLDHLIALHQRKLETLNLMKKGFMQVMFPQKEEVVPRLRFADFNDRWEQRKLGEVTTSYSGGTPAVGKSEYYGGEIPFIRSAEINSDSTELFISESGLNNSSAKMVDVGDILYAMYGATSGEVGISRINGAINQAILAIRTGEGYDSQYIMQWLRSQKQKIIDKYLQGGQGNLSGSIIKKLQIEFPSYTEQKKIGIFLREIDFLIALHQHKIDKLQSLKKAYLQKMFI